VPALRGGFTVPGQYINITDVDSGKMIRKPISVSPYRARSTAPGSDVSVVEILLDTNSPNGRPGPVYCSSSVAVGRFTAPPLRLLIDSSPRAPPCPSLPFL
jgi:hypothetical protein